MRIHLTRELDPPQGQNHNGSTLAELLPEEIAVLPKKVLVELSAPAAEGDRRRQMKPVVISMVANGFASERIFALVREMYEASFTSKEIRDFIQWAVQHKDRWTSTGKFVPGSAPVRRTLTNEERIANAEKFLAGFRCTADDLVAHSKVLVAGEASGMACLYLYWKYKLSDLINVVLDFKLDSSGRPSPYGPGITRSVYQWRRHIDQDGVPHSNAGCKYRLNPVRPANLGKDGYTAWRGSGYQGAYTNGDIERVIYVMAESDLLSMDIQASMLAKLPLAISSIVDTGGKSLHADILLTRGAEEGRTILNDLYALGFDSNTSSPSSLERMPGDIRKIGARDGAGTEQRLLYLNPQPTGDPICGWGV
jgi:hypothetical protein